MAIPIPEEPKGYSLVGDQLPPRPLFLRNPYLRLSRPNGHRLSGAWYKNFSTEPRARDFAARELAGHLVIGPQSEINPHGREVGIPSLWFPGDGMGFIRQLDTTSKRAMVDAGLFRWS